MDLVISPNETGLKNYTSHRDCPISRALIRLGYRDVIVNPSRWRAKKKVRMLFLFVFPWYKEVHVTGRIPPEADHMSFLISGIKQIDPVIIHITENP